MNNADFWAEVAAIINEGFSAEGLQNLDRYAEWFIEGRLVYKRFSPLEQHGCAAGGTTHVVATLLAAAEDGANSGAAPNVSSFKRELERGARQVARIGNWTYSTPDIYLSDMHDENVLRSEEGTVFVVDCDIRINTPDLRAGGTRILTTDVEFS